MYHGIVQEVLSVMPFDENGNLAVAIGADPPAALIEALSAYKIALAAVRAEDAKIRAEQARQARESQ